MFYVVFFDADGFEFVGQSFSRWDDAIAFMVRIFHKLNPNVTHWELRKS